MATINVFILSFFGLHSPSIRVMNIYHPWTRLGVGGVHVTSSNVHKELLGKTTLLHG